eukprot:3419967-Alexandrium_andersonii.AAC.1
MALLAVWMICSSAAPTLGEDEAGAPTVAPALAAEAAEAALAALSRLPPPEATFAAAATRPL